MKCFAVVFGLIGLMFSSANALADCRCSCVNGQIEAVCTSPSDLPPVCAPRACTAKPLRASLVADKASASNKAMRQCHETTVLNPQTGTYLSKQVCQ